MSWYLSQGVSHRNTETALNVPVIAMSSVGCIYLSTLTAKFEVLSKTVHVLQINTICHYFSANIRNKKYLSQCNYSTKTFSLLPEAENKILLKMYYNTAYKLHIF